MIRGEKTMEPKVSGTVAHQLTKNNEVAAKIAEVFAKRAQLANERFSGHVKKAFSEHLESLTTPIAPWDLWTKWLHYSIDTVQRSVLFGDTLRRRGNNF